MKMGFIKKIFFKKKEIEETKTERVKRIINAEAGRHFMFLFDYNIDTEDLDLFYENGWEFISFGGHLCSSHFFKKRSNSNSSSDKSESFNKDLTENQK